MNKVQITGLFLLFFLTGCGKSPFLEETPSNNETQGLFEIQGDLFFTQSDIHIKTYWRKAPHVGQEGKALIILHQRNGAPINDIIDLRLMLWMPTMGHGSFPITVSRIAPGAYEASEIFFTMPGFWNLHYQIFKDEKLIEEVKWGFNL